MSRSNPQGNRGRNVHRRAHACSPWPSVRRSTRSTRCCSRRTTSRFRSRGGSINSNLFDSATRSTLGRWWGWWRISSAGSASIDVATNGSLYTFTLDASQTNAWNTAATAAANAATNNLSLWNALYDPLGRGTQVTNSLAMWNALYDALGAWKLSTNGNGNAATFLNGVGGYTTAVIWFSQQLSHSCGPRQHDLRQQFPSSAQCVWFRRNGRHSLPVGPAICVKWRV